MAGTRMVAAVWVSIWAAFFLCQLFPLAYLLMLALVASRALFASSPAASAWGATATGVVAVVAVGVVGRMKALSARFQLDFSKKHVDHVLRGHAHALRPHAHQH